MRNSTNKKASNQLLNSECQVMPYHREKEIIPAVLAGRLNERYKIAHEIQENVNQILIASLLYIELAKTDKESSELCLEKASLFVSSVIKQLAIMSQTLEPGLTQQGDREQTLFGASDKMQSL